ncbi:Uncharacterised protein [Mycobacteroides abscessus subsp. abscessus]|nr:Uncharacterised protein [Mycobacteroides abscessus subsp. abscessus]
MSANCHGSSGSHGGSTRSTSAPSSASVRVATGPATTRVRSSTRTPRSGWNGAAIAPAAAALSSMSAARLMAICATAMSNGMSSGSPSAVSRRARWCG